jgi:TolB-like protein
MVKTGKNTYLAAQPWWAKAFVTVALCLSLGSLSACSCFNCTPLESYLGGEKNLISFSYEIADELVSSAYPPLIPRHPEMAVLVTTFVDNNNLEKTSRFGRTLQEHVASRLVQAGYTVREVKMADSLRIEPRSGETILSRDINRLQGENRAQAILAGTYSRINRKLYVSARLINPVDNNIIATDDFQLCMDDDLLTLFRLQKYTDIDTPVEDPGQPFLNSIL